MSDNAKQREYWNGDVAKNWVARLTHFERSLTGLTDALLSFAAPKPGMAVLDIGCGAGTTTDAVAKLVSPGKAVGLDISEPLIEAAREVNGERAEYILADASDYAFSPEYDLVISRLGVMFFADPVKSFANIRTSLRRGGKLAFICWRPQSEISYLSEPYQAVRDLFPENVPTPDNAPGPFGLADGERTRSILEQAGFKHVRVEPAAPLSLLGNTLEEAVEQVMNMGPLARVLREADEATKAQVRIRIAPVLAKHQTASGIEPPAACWLVGATA